MRSLFLAALLLVAGLAHAGQPPTRLEVRRAFVLECVEHVMRDTRTTYPGQLASVIQSCNKGADVYVSLFPHGVPAKVQQ